MACAENDDSTLWPTGYRGGVFEGLFIDPHERLTVDSWSAQWASRVISPLQEPGTVIEALAEKVRDLPLSSPPAHVGVAIEILKFLTDSAHYLPAEARPAWQKLIGHLQHELIT